MTSAKYQSVTFQKYRNRQKNAFYDIKKQNGNKIEKKKIY
jgi:hypothetical protein